MLRTQLYIWNKTRIVHTFVVFNLVTSNGVWFIVGTCFVVDSASVSVVGVYMVDMMYVGL